MKLQSRINKFCWYGLILCVFVALVFLVLFIFSIISEFIENDELTFVFCLTQECIAVIDKHFSRTLDLFRSCCYIIMAFAGLFSAHIGVSNYKLAVSNSILNNHISNFKLFCEFVDREKAKREIICDDAIDHFLLYSTIYPDSKSGVFKNFKGFEKKIKKIEDVIDESNGFYLSGNRKVKVKGPIFSHVFHQHEMKAALFELGINISINHRNEFNEVETQVLELLNTMSIAFVDKPRIIDLTERKYI